jgi:hypothetical protein
MATITHVDESLMQLLSADAGIASLVGSRIYATQAPQGVLMPIVVYQRQSGTRIASHMLSSGGLVRATYIVSCVASSLMETRNLSLAVRQCLQYKHTEAIRLLYVEEDDDTQELPSNGEQMPMYRTDLTIRVTYSE